VAILTGGTAFVAGAWISSRFVVNVVNYRTVPVTSDADDIRRFATALPRGVTLILAACLVMIGTRRSRAGSGEKGPSSFERKTNGVGPAPERASTLRVTWPAWALAAIVSWWWVSGAPNFVSLCGFAVATGCGITSLGRWGWSCADVCSTGPAAGNGVRASGGGAICAVLLTLSIGLATAWQVYLQHVYWRHFALGFGDFGLFTQELEFCLPFKDVPDRFADTRMGYHAIFLFYALAPLYALFRSPLFLMVVGPLALNIAALAFYRWARRFTGSAGIALLVAVSWLLLPSISRLPFANQYGFQSVYLAVPFIAFAACFAMAGRWRASHACLALGVLCEETVCGVAVGWGVYLALFHRDRRVTGVLIAAISAGYLLLATLWIIPHFAAGAMYTRLDLFGEVSATAVVERLFGRARSGLYLLAVATALLPGLIRGGRLLVAIVPTLALVLLIENPDYLNIKYWHQSSILPLLFMAGAAGALGLSTRGPVERAPGARLAGALGLFTTVLLMHQFLGVTPLARSYRVHLANASLRVDDPRMAAVEYVRSRYARERTRITATEMMAAHFCDYFEIRKPTWSPDAPTDPSGDVLVLDHHDGRDNLVRAMAMDRFESHATGAGYELVADVAGVSVWVHPSAIEGEDTVERKEATGLNREPAGASPSGWSRP
jgi:hypothetical protein